MADLYVAMAVMVVGGAGLGVLAARWSRRRSARAVAVAAAVAVGVLFVHALVLVDNLVLARVVPGANVIVWGNVAPLAVGVLAGLVWAVKKVPAWRRGVLVAALAGLGVERAYGPVFGDRPRLRGERWVAGVCRQSSNASCSAAAAATLLMAHGIDTSEAEMAELCLTRATGTSMLGLYRGMVKKTAGTGWEVKVFRGTFGEFKEAGIGPALLSVGLSRGARVDPRYERDWGWARGVKHTVVFFGYADGGKVELGDPDVGRERWFERGVEDLWFGEAVYLVKTSDE